MIFNDYKWFLMFQMILMSFSRVKNDVLMILMSCCYLKWFLMIENDVQWSLNDLKWYLMICKWLLMI